MMESRHLPIIQANGSWIERPDLFLLARMAYEDNADESMIWQIHDTMIRADNASPDLNAFEMDIKRRHLRRQLRRRSFAGHVLLELVRIAMTIGASPSAAQGYRLAAFNHHRHFGRSSAEGLEDELRKGFSAFRGTAHLQAAAVIADPNLSEIETSESDSLRFLAWARGLEIFMDNKVTSTALNWNPWRVPSFVGANFSFEGETLNREERAYIGIN